MHDTPVRVSTNPRQMQTDRLEAFSDGVFAIAATLLILAIRRPPATGQLVHHLLALWPSYAAYATTFMVIGLIWANHHAMFVHIQTADRSLVFLNVLLLANVSFLPFPIAILADALRTGHDQHTAAVLYGVTWTVGGVLFNAVWLYASQNRRLLAEQLTDDQARNISRRFLIGPTLYGVATATALLSAPLALALFAALAVFFWLPTQTERATMPSSHD